MKTLEMIGQSAKEAKVALGLLEQNKKTDTLLFVADALCENADEILTGNKKDTDAAKENGMSEGLLDRLLLTKERINAMAQGLRKVAALPDPIGSVLSMDQRPNGLLIGKKRVPLGVVGVIYESRPNVTSDVFGLCFKTGNAVILRGGSDALHSNTAIVSVIRGALDSCGISMDAVQLLTDTSRETATAFMKLNQYIDVLIPRGGAGLISTVVQNSTVPVIETGTGNCHIYVDECADFDMALDIIDNAKTQRLGVCNACESLVIHSAVLEEFFPLLVKRLTEKNIVIRADERARALCPQCEEATEEDFGKEYLDRLISVKTVDSPDEAISHINRYNTGHSEAVITKNYDTALRFLNEIDAAAVYVNASTRFTDGEEFGFGAEIGISTQKLHARGPMGLEALTTTKYIVFGQGQVRK
ncbi:MAG: glutamate-5-semialdehyde dehydrogenase [Lachnospiraceae bacterium]|nr:glutamate-5-semialdehyde dehydrogenase [Lachnospiraceae bacterium]